MLVQKYPPFFIINSGYLIRKNEVKTLIFRQGKTFKTGKSRFYELFLLLRV